MKDDTLAENHSELIIRTKEARNFSGNVMPEVRFPTGYKITVDGITLEVKSYTKSGPICHCSGCGQVTPSLKDLKNYTTEFYNEWMKFHNSMFRNLHEENLRNLSKVDSK